MSRFTSKQAFAKSFYTSYSVNMQNNNILELKKHAVMVQVIMYPDLA